jgi:hypothetical protein
MAVRCPSGHESTSTDYCDVCGAPIGGPATPSPAAASTGGAAAPTTAPQAPPPAASKACPSCQSPNPHDALFCEDCGYDFTTGQSPPAASSAPPSSVTIDPAPHVSVDWVAEVWVDPDWYARNRDEASDPCPAAGAPKVFPLVGTGALIGRPSASRHAQPQIDCTPDSSVSRKHAQLMLDGDRWYIEDLGSTNGTYVAGASAPIPDDPIPSGQRRELSDNDRIYVGAWSRIVVRHATSQERSR